MMLNRFFNPSHLLGHSDFGSCSRPQRSVRSLLRTMLGLVLGTGFMLQLPMVQAASFDCAKARSPLEKLICSQPELDAADTRMGEAFRKANAAVPLKGFVGLTQRVFLLEYRGCAFSAPNRPLPTAQAVRQCAVLANKRADELDAVAGAQFYSQVDKSKAFTQDDLAILILPGPGLQRIQLWGNWMPDANDPKPFPQGVLCDLQGSLTPAKGGFKADFDEEVLLQVSPQSVKIGGHLMCTPRNGVAEGVYPRVR